MNELSHHYLKDELYRLIRSDDSILNFLQAGSLDGLWYWDVENPEEDRLKAYSWVYAQTGSRGSVCGGCELA